MSAESDLIRLYDASIDGVEGRRACLELDLEYEDRYAEAVCSILKEAHAEALRPGFEHWSACAGGGDNVKALLAAARTDVQSAAVTCSLPNVPFVCGYWPSDVLNASCQQTEFGGIVRINRGLLSLLRIVCQEVAKSMEAITGDADAWGSDVKSPAHIAGELETVFDHHLNGMDVRFQSPLSVMQGPREEFRRRLNYLAIASVLAHEYGHLMSKEDRRAWYEHTYPDDPPLEIDPAIESEGATLLHGDLALKLGGAPASVPDEIMTWSEEFAADTLALAIVAAPPLNPAEGPSLWSSMPTMIVDAIQLCDAWRRLASGMEVWGWSHLSPNMRMEMACSSAKAHGGDALAAFLRHFQSWLYEVLQLERWVNEADKLGTSTEFWAWRPLSL